MHPCPLLSLPAFPAARRPVARRPVTHRPVTPRRVLIWTLGLLVGATGLATSIASPGQADDRRALAARQGGRILPLEVLIGQVEAIVPGRLLAAELDDDDDIFVYELRWQLADGRRLEIELDARDGRWLALKGPRLETVFRRLPTATAPAAIPGR